MRVRNEVSNIFDEMMIPRTTSTVEKNRLKIGYTEIGQEVDLGLKQASHTLISGISRSGKTQMALHLLDSLTKYASVVVYSMKPGDFFMYRNKVRLVEDKYEMFSLLRMTVGEIEKRANKIREQSEAAGHVVECTDRPMIVMIDEYAALSKDMDDATENAIEKIAAVGAGLNVYLYIITQVPKKSVMLGTLRDNMMTDIAFKQRSPETSRMAIGSNAAMMLPLGQCIVRNVDRSFKVTYMK